MAKKYLSTKKLVNSLIAMVIISALAACTKEGKSENDHQGVEVWNDYQRDIEEKYNHFPNTKNAAMQFGDALRLVSTDFANLEKNDLNFAKAISCVVAAAIKDGFPMTKAITQSSEIRDIVLNSKERQNKYLKYNKGIGNRILPVVLPATSSCEFKVSGDAK